MDDGIEVTVRDLATGVIEAEVIQNDYVIVTAGSCYVDGIRQYPAKGTHVLTVKGRKG